MVQGLFNLLFSNLNSFFLQPLAHLFERLGMANILRTIVSGPRQRHAEAGLDLCYVTPNIVVTSGPSSTYPARAYRNPTDALVRWLDEKHGSEWMIWEFRAEGTGYPDDEVYGRVRHYPWPDHHPPPFRLIPAITAGMRNWLQEDGAKEKGRTVVVHCKAGKGRSGTVATSYLVSQEGWEVKDALNRFTQRRMRPGFGAGVSIPSQVRWVGYVDRWTKGGKKYVERKAVVQEVHVWGLREGVKVSVDGFVEEGKKIKAFHTFEKNERLVVDGSMQNGSILADLAGSSNDTKVAAPSDVLEKRGNKDLIDDSKSNPNPNPNSNLSSNKPEKTSSSGDDPGSESGGRAVIFRPKGPITLETSDICIDFERRNRAKYGWTMVTSVAHVWFNVFFEGLAAQEQDSNAEKEKVDVLNPPKSGVFNIEWDAMDGIKGTSRKGIRAFDRLAVVWAVEEGGGSDGKEPASQLVLQPAPGEPVPESKAADWRGSDTVVENGEDKDDSSSKTTVSGLGLGLGKLSIDAVKDKDLGLRTESPSSANISKANSVRSEHKSTDHPSSSSATATATQRITTDDSVFEGIRTHSNPDPDQSGENSPASAEASGKSRYENVDESGIDLNNGSKLAAAVDKARAIAGHATGSTT